MLHIRPFQPEDVPFIIKIEETVFPHPWSADSFLTLSKDPHFWLVVACEEGMPVGYFVAQVVPPEAELHNIAVEPSRQRKGVGAALFKHFIDKLRNISINNVFLLVRSSNNTAIQFYQRFGFSFLDRRKNYYSHPVEDAHVFHKRLDRETPTR